MDFWYRLVNDICVRPDPYRSAAGHAIFAITLLDGLTSTIYPAVPVPAKVTLNQRREHQRQRVMKCRPDVCIRLTGARTVMSSVTRCDTAWTFYAYTYTRWT